MALVEKVPEQQGHVQKVSTCPNTRKYQKSLHFFLGGGANAHRKCPEIDCSKDGIGAWLI